MHEPGADEKTVRRLEWALLHAQDRNARTRLHLDDARVRARAAEERLRVIENSVSFRLGAAIVAALKSWRKLPDLVSVLANLRKHRTHGRGDSVDKLQATSAPDADLRFAHLLAERRLPAERLPDLRIAAVLDEFSYAALAPDCRLVNLPLQGFEGVLDEFAPHLLLVESAWRGFREEWRHRVCPASADLRYLLDCCRRRGIPTVFWNKEDPLHFDDFIEAAALFDHVLTTDSDCIPRYVQELGHDRVGTLPFFCQPRLHHPIESAEREVAACFAGSWYRFYPERSKQFDMIVDAVAKLMPVVIFDRNSGRGDPDFAFPERYAPLIRNALPYSEIATAYKGYEYAITINSVLHSPTMLARRVYELLACNTIVVSNKTESVSRNFGGLIVTGETADEIERGLRDLSDSPEARRKLRLLGLREVLDKHTAVHRLDTVASTALGVRYPPPRASIVVAARARSVAQARIILNAFCRQTWERKRLYLLLPSGVAASEIETPPVTVTFLEEGENPHPVAVEVDSWLALFHPDDYYGADYLTDLALATLFASGNAVGKGRFWKRNADGSLRTSEGPVYCGQAALWRRAMISPWPATESRSFSAELAAMESEDAPISVGVAIDEFNYCREGGDACIAVAEVPSAHAAVRKPADARRELHGTN